MLGSNNIFHPLIASSRLYNNKYTTTFVLCYIRILYYIYIYIYIYIIYIYINQSINQYLIYNALVYNKSLSVKTVGVLNSQERGYYFRLVIVKSASEEVRLELCLEGR